MKMEYLEGDFQDSPLLRLFEFEKEELVALREACLALADGRLEDFKLHEQPWMQRVDGSQLILRRSKKNRGAKWGRLTSDPYTVEYNIHGWLEVADKIEPIISDSMTGFQWLTNEGDFHLLLSWSGSW